MSRVSFLVFALLTLIHIGRLSAQSDDLWRLVGSPSGTDSPALMQVADLDASDPDVAGLMFRCVEHMPHAVLVLVDPIPPRTPADVEFNVGAERKSYPAAPITTGAGLLISGNAADLFADRWRDQAVLNVAAHVADKTVTAKFFLHGLAPKLSVLQQSCLKESGH